MDPVEEELGARVVVERAVDVENVVDVVRS